MKKNLLLGFLIILTTVIVNKAVMYLNFQESGSAALKTADSERVVSALREVHGSLKEAEAAQREYMLTGKPAYLEWYQSGVPKILNDLSALKLALEANKQQLQRFQILSERVAQRLEYLRETTRTFEEDGLESVRQQMGRDGMRTSFGAVTSMADEMEQVALEERRRYQEISDESTRTADRSFLLGTALTLFLLGAGFFSMRRYTTSQSRQASIKTDQAELATLLAGDRSAADVCRKTLTFFARKIGVQVGAFYLIDQNDDHLKLACGFGDGIEGRLPQTLKKEGSVVGDAVQSKEVKLLTDLPRDYPAIQSSTGSGRPYSILLVPVLFEGRVLGVLEMGSFQAYSAKTIEFVDEVRPTIGMGLQAAESRSQIQSALDTANEYSQKLQAQQEELRVTNEELEEQADALKRTKDRLQEQQEELRQSNEELEQQTQVLEAQKEELGITNHRLLEAKAETDRHAARLKQASQYKSEFLANMSHELRTPLNSLLILATVLRENKEGNLTEKQINFAKTIYKSGNDLLSLINDILDLSKVEAGKLDLHIETVSLPELFKGLKGSFEELATTKGITFDLRVSEELPAEIRSDKQRLEQVLRNFLSNAFKFTDQGRVILSAARPDENQVADSDLTVDGALCLTVEDTGVGIDKDKQNVIFEAFQQADGSTNRKYGGTGLGLTISKELATLLGGSVTMESEPGRGSRFHLIIPETLSDDRSTAALPAFFEQTNKLDIKISPEDVGEQGAGADIVSLKPAASPEAERVLLIVEDDLDFAQVIMDTAAELGFDCVHTPTGEAAMQFLSVSLPAAVVLDIRLPDVNGLSILKQIKGEPSTRHIPVHVISSLDYSKHALQMGAIGYLVKPVQMESLRTAFEGIENVISKRVRKVLIVEDDPTQRESICELLDSDAQTDCIAVGDAASAVEYLKSTTFDCMILDLKLPGMSGFDLLKEMNANDSMSRPPVVVYTGKDLSRDEEQKLRAYSDTIVLKGARSPERLIDEVSLFLHRVNADVPQALKEILSRKHEESQNLAGRKLLVVDDDLRNVFALTSVLEENGMVIEVARNGREALDVVKKTPDLDLVLMDIMMPEMDGFEAMQRIRVDLKNDHLPIIALTAKAMKGDEEKCLNAGANDYLAKPVDVGRLMSLIKVWTTSRSEVRI